MRVIPMNIVRRNLTFFYLVLHNFASAPFAVAADQIPSQPYTNSWCYGMHWPSFGWIFPVLFFVLMIVIFFLIMRRGIGCGWRDKMICGPGYRENMNQSFGQQSESALEILDKRYAKGEIDKQEYEEKKAAISSGQGNAME